MSIRIAAGIAILAACPCASQGDEGEEPAPEEPRPSCLGSCRVVGTEFVCDEDLPSPEPGVGPTMAGSPEGRAS